MRDPLEKRGYRYINIDVCCFEKNEPTIMGDSHILPFRDETFDLVISKDSLEHFYRPWDAIREVHRVIKRGGLFIIWVPFMHPFHGNDLYRYSPLGLNELLSEFRVLKIESPLWAFTVIGVVLGEGFKHLRMGWMERSVKTVCAWLDSIFMKRQQQPSAFAAAYRLIVQKKY